MLNNGLKQKEILMRLRDWEGEWHNGAPLNVTNYYKCEYCGPWSDIWTSSPDDECPNCGDAYSPEFSEFEVHCEGCGQALTEGLEEIIDSIICWCGFANFKKQED